MTVVSAKAKTKAGAKMKIRAMHIEPAANGFTAHTHFMHPTPSDGKYMPEPEPHKAVFSGKKAAKDLAAHVMNTMAPTMADPATNPSGAMPPADQTGLANAQAATMAED